MKKMLLLVAVALFFGIGTADAQKYGHVNSGEILEVMPGIDSLQIKLKAFQEDLQTMYESMMTEYQQKKDKFDREVGTMSSAVRQVREKEFRIWLPVFRSSRPMRKRTWRRNSMSWQSPFRTLSRMPSIKWPKVMDMPISSIPKFSCITVLGMTLPRW